MSIVLPDRYKAVVQEKVKRAEIRKEKKLVPENKWVRGLLAFFLAVEDKLKIK